MKERGKGQLPSLGLTVRLALLTRADEVIE